MSIERTSFGNLPNGDNAELFLLSNANGMKASITNLGGIIVSLEVPDRDGTLADVILGKDDLAGYLNGHPHFGCITGRVAGRIGSGRFEIAGKHYALEINNPPNALHGGSGGYHSILWDASIVEVDGIEKLQLSTIDPDGNNGYPGNVTCTVTYALLDDNSLEINYTAQSDHITPFNITNHAYFNLAGEGQGDALEHEVQILSNSVAAVDANLTLTGIRKPVTPGFNDYQEPVTLKDREKLVGGNADLYYFAKDGRVDEPRLVAKAHDPKSGRIMEVLTTEPGVQFYAAVSLSTEELEIGKNGKHYPPFGGLCFETQDYPDSINFPEMGDAILRPGEPFQSTTRYRFSNSDAC